MSTWCRPQSSFLIVNAYDKAWLVLQLYIFLQWQQYDRFNANNDLLTIYWILDGFFFLSKNPLKRKNEATSGRKEGIS